MDELCKCDERIQSYIFQGETRLEDVLMEFEKKQSITEIVDN